MLLSMESQRQVRASPNRVAVSPYPSGSEYLCSLDHGTMGLVPHVIAPLLPGSKGEKEHVTGQRWEEPERSSPIPTDEGHSAHNPAPLNERNGDFTPMMRPCDSRWYCSAYE